MPNWCSTGITFYSDNKDELTLLKEKIDEIYDGKPTQENGFGHGWLGDYANIFYPKIRAEKIDCRGAIGHIETDIRRVENVYAFSVSTETAWSAKIGMWYKILKDFYPDVRLAYIAEECGCEYYVKWDDSGLFYSQDFYVDIAYPVGDDGIDYIDDHAFNSMKEIYAWLDAHLPFDYAKKECPEDLEREILSKLEAYDSDEFYCTIAKYNIINPADFDFYKM